MYRAWKRSAAAGGVAAAVVFGVGAVSSASGASGSVDDAQARLRAVIGSEGVRAHLRATADPMRIAHGEPTNVVYPDPENGTRGQIGPDVIVGELYQVGNYGTVSGISAFSVGTISCNAGDEWLNWVSSTNQHPVIAQNLYRYKVVDGAGRFEQVGQSWLKHGFLALTGNACYNDCDGTGGSHLGIHCSDPYSASLNGSQSNLGPRSQVNASTGFFPYPWSAPSAPPTIGRRLQVHNTDLAAAENPGALYFVEGQYIAPDDAMAGNGNNNASYRRVAVSGTSSYSLSLVGGQGTRREQSAVFAWKEVDPAVTVVHADVPMNGGVRDGRFTIAYKATDLGNGTWRYEYAVQNLNSHASGGSFSVPIPECANITNVGFHDVDSHSGEPFSLTDWTSTVGNGSVTWATQTYGENQNANALRWSTTYNFRFDSDIAPADGTATIGLFRPWTPSSVGAAVAVPNPDACPNCPADFDGDGELTVSDFTAFRSAYLGGERDADMNGDGELTVGDFTAFRNAYLAGCP